MNLPKIFRLGEFSLIVSVFVDVSAGVQGLAMVDRKVFNAAPPSSDLGEWF